MSGTPLNNSFDLFQPESQSSIMLLACLIFVSSVLVMDHGLMVIINILRFSSTFEGVYYPVMDLLQKFNFGTES